MVHLAIWFSGGASLDPREVDSNKKPLNLEQSIVARMIYSYIVHINPHSWYGHHVAIQNIIDLSLLMTIYESLDNIDNMIFDFFTWLGNKEQEEGKTLWIHFTLDEYNQLLPSDRETTDEEDSKFHNILNSLSTIRHTLPGIFTNLLSGTHMHDLSKNFVHGGRVYVKRIELLNFDRNEQEELYLKQNYPLSIAKKSLFYSLGGHARLIELFGQKKDDSIQDIMRYLDECTGIYPGAIRIGLELDKSTLEILIALCISQKSIEFDMKINGKTLKQLQRSMILFIQDSHVEERTVHIPIIILLKLIKTLIRLEDDHFLKELNIYLQNLILYSINLEKFERFNQIFLKTKLNCLCLLRNHNIIRTIHIHKIFPCVDEYCEIDIPSDYITFEKLSQEFPLTPSSNVIFKNGNGDVFTILKSTDDQYLFCNIQVIHSYANILGKEELDKSTTLVNTKETLQQLWGEQDLKIIKLFITNRPIDDNVTLPTIASNSNLYEYYGPFSIVVSYLGCVKMNITDISEEDFVWIIGSQYLRAIRLIKTNWTSSTTQQEKVHLLLNNLSLYQLKQLLLFTKDDEQVIMEAITSEEIKNLNYNKK